MPPLTPKGGIFLHLTSHSLVENTAQWKITGAMILHCCRKVNGIKNKKHKKQPWGNVECFAFGGATVHFASLETSFHAANHTIPPPPSNEGCPLCPKDKNRSPFHGEKTPDGKKFPGRRLNQISQMILHGRDAILRVRVK